MYFDLWCDVFLLYPFLYVIYYCSKFQLFKICQLVYSPLFFFLNSATFYVKKWTYRITVICLFLLAVNKTQFSSVQFSSGGFSLEGFVRGGFVRSPSVRILLLQQKVKYHFKFQVSYV